MTYDFARYHRQMLLPGFGAEGQERLRASTAAVLGCGALGCLAADLLARAGVGHLVIVDRDVVEPTNLQRQVLFDEQDAATGVPKAVAAQRRLRAVNSAVRVSAIVDDLHRGNIERHVAPADVLVNGLDNFETRYLANDVAVKHGIPFVYGGAVGTTGAAFAVLPHTQAGTAPWETQGGNNRATPCLRCLFEEPPAPGSVPTCDTVGVLASAVTTIASFEVAEALKVLTANYELVAPTLLNVDLWHNRIANLKVTDAYARGDCPCCKRRRFEFLDGARGSGATTLCGRDAVQLRPHEGAATLDLDAVAARLGAEANVRLSVYMLRAEIRDNGKPYSLSLFPDGRAIVHGTSEPSIARGLYAKYVGA
jgi:adenylyltransferase/sulfurtransferase